MGLLSVLILYICPGAILFVSGFLPAKIFFAGIICPMLFYQIIKSFFVVFSGNPQNNIWGLVMPVNIVQKHLPGKFCYAFFCSRNVPTQRIFRPHSFLKYIFNF